jgi:hypothetical protein
MSRIAVVIIPNRLVGVGVGDEKEIGIYQVSGHLQEVTKCCGDNPTMARASGQHRRLGSTRGATAPPAPSHTSSRGLEDTASAPSYGQSGWHRRSIGAQQRQTVTLAI